MTKRPLADGRVLVVDDSGLARVRIRRFLTAEGRRDVAEAADGDEALALYEKSRPALVLIDHVMRGKDGVQVARLMLERDPGARIVMLTVVSDPALRQRALEAGVVEVINKHELDGLRVILHGDGPVKQ